MQSSKANTTHYIKSFITKNFFFAVTYFFKLGIILHYLLNKHFEKKTNFLIICIFQNNIQ